MCKPPTVALVRLNVCRCFPLSRLPSDAKWWLHVHLALFHNANHLLISGDIYAHHYTRLSMFLRRRSIKSTILHESPILSNTHTTTRRADGTPTLHHSYPFVTLTPLLTTASLSLPNTAFLFAAIALTLSISSTPTTRGKRPPFTLAPSRAGDPLKLLSGV